MQFGYVRVSSLDQNPNLQIDALTAAGCEKIFLDKITGIKYERPEFNNLKQQLRSGDTVVVYKLDRLGRTLKELLNLVEGFEKQEVQFKSLKENIDTSTPVGKLIFHLFAALAEFERELIRERVAAGHAAGRARGISPGRPKLLNKQQEEKLKDLHANTKLPIADLCKMFGIKRGTVYKYLRN